MCIYFLDLYLSLCVWYCFFNQFGKQMLAAELICWQNLHVFFFSAFPRWQHPIPTPSLLHISIPGKGRAKKCTAQVRRCFIGNNKKKTIEIQSISIYYFP